MCRLLSVVVVAAFLLVARSPQLDKVGRKPFLLWGSVGVTGSLAVLSVSFPAGLPGLAFAASAALVAAYALSFGPVTWLVTAEMFPAGIRGKALGIGQVRDLIFADLQVDRLNLPFHKSSLGSMLAT